MSRDEDFWAYVAARWPALVRSLGDRGATPAEAHERGAEALSRARRRWASESRHGDVDALVRDELAAVWRDRDRRHDDELTVLAPPTAEELRDHDRARRARALKRVSAVLVPLALVVGGLSWWSTRDEPPEDEDELPAAQIERAENPLPAPWYADGVLHLAHVTLRVDGLVDLAALGDGAVYGDREGRVVSVGDDGGRQLLGRKDPDELVTVTEESDWAAWLDPDGQRLVVDDATTGDRVGDLAADPGTSVIAVDGTTVFFRDDQGSHGWLPAGTAVVPITPAELLDVRSRIRAFQLDPATIQVVQSFFNVAYALPGHGARLSPDGDTVATRLDASTYGRIALYDSRSGEELTTGLTGSEVALAFSLGERQSVTYVVAKAADMSTTGPFLRGFTGGDLVIRHCEVSRLACRDVVELPDATEVPVLTR